MNRMAWEFIRERYVTVATVPSEFYDVRLFGIPGHVITIYSGIGDGLAVIVDDGKTGRLLDVVEFDGTTFEDMLSPKFREHAFNERDPRPMAIVIDNAMHIPAHVHRGAWDLEGGGAGPLPESRQWADAMVRGALATQIAGMCGVPVVLTVPYDTDPRPQPWLFAMGEQVLRMNGPASFSFQRFVSAGQSIVSDD